MIRMKMTHLRALAMVAKRAGITRPYIRCVHISLSNKKAVATDGHILMVAPIELECGHEGMGPHFTIVIERVEAAIKASPYAHSIEITQDTIGSVKVAGTGQKYPAWRKAYDVEIGKNEIAAKFDLKLVRVLSKAADILTSSRNHYYIWQNGLNAAPFRFSGSDVDGCIMPLQVLADNGPDEFKNAKLKDVEA